MTRRSRTEYFTRKKNEPLPLKATAYRVVRFEEVDPLNVVWHGRYPSYLEDGRTEFGEKYDIRYSDMLKSGFIAPIIQMRIDYHKPLTFGENFSIETALYWSDAAKLNFTYRIISDKNGLAATGFTVQIFVDLDKTPLLIKPELVEKLYKRWKSLLEK
jgi:acyl-CoA thioester hydrolase